MAMPTWIYEAQALGSTVGGFAAAAIAYAGIRIAHRQSITAAQKLRLDMFPLRFAVYNAVLDAMIETLNQNFDSIVTEKTEKCHEKILEAQFLFDADTYDYLAKIEDAVMTARNLTQTQKSESFKYNQEKQEVFSMLHSHQTWLRANITGLAVRLSPSLRVDDGTASNSQMQRGDTIARTPAPVA